MEILKALLLGIIQGLTEFLPVSSSGHIELGKALLGFDLGENNLLFTILVHFATVLSTIVVFRKDIIRLIRGFFAFKWNDETQFAAKILLSMIPVTLIGLFFESQVENFFSGRILLVGFMLWVTALLLYLSRFSIRRKNQQKSADNSPTNRNSGEVRMLDAFLIGIAQAVAVLPGISRSGSTIATGLMLGVDPTRIARFSFLMVLPPILGAALLKILDLGEMTITQADAFALGAGFFAAFISGLLACTLMIRIVQKGKLGYFALYCLIIGAIAVAAGLF